MHTRGKSVLFNRLVGAQVSIEASIPATANGVVAETGPPEAWAVDSSGERHELPHDPAKFAKALDRKASKDFAIAYIAGPFRMPPGLLLIDTPGIGDPGTVVGDVYSDLADRWRRSGAGAVAVVVAVPPGLAGADVRFIREAKQYFPSTTELLLKRTSIDVTDEDLQDVVSDARSRFGVELAIVSDVAPRGRWGVGELSQLERSLERLAAKAAADLSPDLQHLDSLMARAAALVNAGRVSSTALQASMAAMGAVETPLTSTVRLAIDDLEAIAVLAGPKPGQSVAFAAEKLLRLASAGAPSAQAALIDALEGKPNDVTKTIEPGALAAVLPGDVIARSIEGGHLALGTLDALATADLDDRLRLMAGRRLVSQSNDFGQLVRVARHLPDLAPGCEERLLVLGQRLLSPLVQLGRSGSPTPARFAEEWRTQDRAFRDWSEAVGRSGLAQLGLASLRIEHEAALRDVTYREFTLWASVAESVSPFRPGDRYDDGAERVRASLLSVDAAAAVAKQRSPDSWHSNIDERCSLVRTAVAATLAPALCQEFAQLYSRSALGMNVPHRRVHLEAGAEWVLTQRPTQYATEVAGWLTSSRTFGGRWANEVQRAPHNAQAAHNSKIALMRIAYVASFLGWGLSVLMFLFVSFANSANDFAAQTNQFGQPQQDGSFGPSVLVWAVSFAVWLATKDRRDEAFDFDKQVKVPDFHSPEWQQRGG